MIFEYQYLWHYLEILKNISPLIWPVRGIRGRATIGRTVEGRSELAELADDFSLVPDANHPAFPTRSKVDDWETKRFSMPRAERQWWVDVGIGMKDSQRNTIEFTLASELTQATQKSAASPNRELRDQAERRKTTTEYWPCRTRQHVPKKEKKRTQGG